MTKKSSKTRTVYRSRKISHRHKHKPELHAIPDLFYLGGAYELIGPTAGAVYSAHQVGDPLLPSLTYGLQTMVLPAVIPAAELTILGLALQWVGKKTGLNKVGIKGVKLL